MTQKEQGDDPTHCCPECGGDVAVLRHKPATRLQRSSLIPTIIWGLLVLAVLAVASPWVQQSLGSQLSIYSMTETTEAERTSGSTFMPVLRADEVQDAPRASAQRLNELYAPYTENDNEQWERAQFRFVFRPPFQSMYDTTSMGLGGPWIKVEAYTAFSDIRGITNSMGMDDYPPDAVEAGYYGTPSDPDSKLALNTRTISMNGGQDIQRRVFPVSIISSILAIWLTLLALIEIPRRLGLRALGLWKLKLALLALAAIIVPVIAMNLRHDTHNAIPARGSTRAAIVNTEWISSEAFAALMLEEDQRQALAETIAELAQSADPDHVLGLQIMKDHASAFSLHTAQLSDQFPLIRVSQILYFEERADGSRNNLDLPESEQGIFTVRMLPLAESLAIAKSTRGTIWFLTLDWMNIIGLLGALWLIRRLLLLIGVLLGYRTQRKRAKRGQCIFCAYPLSPQALAARSGDSGS